MDPVHKKHELGARVELMIRPATGRFHPDDPRWAHDVKALEQALRARMDTPHTHPQAGMKGWGDATQAIVITITSLNLLGHAVDVLKTWLARDRERSFRCTVNSGHASAEIEVKGHDEAATHRLVASVRDLLEPR